MFRFENHIFYYAFALIPLCIGIYIWYTLRIRRKLKKLGDPALIKQLIPNVSRAKRNTRFILWTLGLTLLILGLCNLQSGTKTQNVKREGADIIVCLDVSNSMLAQDLSPNRLERAKFALEKMIDKLEGDRLGLVVFAGDAYVQLPITTDYSAAKLFLESINTRIVPTQGTNITAAINKAMESFGKDEGKNKSIVIITDGEDHEEDAITAAKEAADKNIMINTIGVGSESGVPIPHVVDGVVSGYKKDKQGNTIVTKLNSDMLKKIAAEANGVYVQATNSDVGLDAIITKIGELDKKQMEEKMYTDYEDQFQWFLGAALLFIFIESMLSERVSRIWKKLNVFKHA
ncbi:MAG: VWA domain-containing protein [Bacteroidetes bacterium]|nr:VWA domain-containing protein [Bacteroidota bacterium]